MIIGPETPGYLAELGAKMQRLLALLPEPVASVSFTTTDARLAEQCLANMGEEEPITIGTPEFTGAGHVIAVSNFPPRWKITICEPRPKPAWSQRP